MRVNIYSLMDNGIDTVVKFLLDPTVWENIYCRIFDKKLLTLRLISIEQEMFHIKNYVFVLFMYTYLFMLLDYRFLSQRYRNKPFFFFFFLFFLENKVLSWPDDYRNIWAFFMENRNQNIDGKYMMPSNVRIKANKLTTNQHSPFRNRYTD